jgi:hypothetical protein
MTDLNELYEQLKQCTVLISADTEKGTGFFVAAEGLILTCAHVVNHQQSVTVYWQNQEYRATVVGRAADPARVDLALIQLNNSIPKQPCVCLDESFQAGDSFYTYGYTKISDFKGESATYQCDGGFGRNPELIKFTDGQAGPGFSGSPLLNKNSKNVCGVISNSRDIWSNLGGYGVPTKVIFEEFPHLKSVAPPPPPPPPPPVQQRTFRFDVRADHTDNRQVVQRFCVPEAREIVNWQPPLMISDGGYSYFERIEIVAGQPNCVDVYAHLQGKGVRRIGGIIVDYLGRGWLKADIIVNYIPR